MKRTFAGLLAAASLCSAVPAVTPALALGVQGTVARGGLQEGDDRRDVQMHRLRPVLRSPLRVLLLQ
jgi:hypothetical protein